MPLTVDVDFLFAALVGYQQKLREIDACMADLRGRSRRRGTARSPEDCAQEGEARWYPDLKDASGALEASLTAPWASVIARLNLGFSADEALTWKKRVKRKRKTA